MTNTFRPCIALLALLLPLPALAQGQPPASPVGVVEARQETVTPARWVPGTVISREDSRVAAEVSGNLVSVLEVGTAVTKEDVLAQLNDRELQLQLRNDEAQVARLAAQLEYLKRQVQRLGTLAESNTAALANLDETTAQRDMLAQELEGAKVARDRTLYFIGRTRVMAPFDGVVVERTRMPGEFINRGEQVVRLVNTRSLEIRVQAPLDVVRHVQAGDAVRVAVNHGAAMESVTVPRDSLVLREGETYIYKVLPDNTARKVTVTVGGGAGDRVSVTGDVKVGDKIVIRGAERLQDGAPITVVGSGGAA